MTTKIVKALKVELLPTEQARLAEKPTENLEAYELYIKDLAYLRLKTPDDYTKASNLFEKSYCI